jgi:hypothetical protein
MFNRGIIVQWELSCEREAKSNRDPMRVVERGAGVSAKHRATIATRNWTYVGVWMVKRRWEF